jgi:hypothetical protein
MAGGLQGSTKGLRFNPRQSAENLEDDSSVGREDSEERALHEAKKREKQDERAKMMQGLQHMKIKIEQKSTEDEEDSDMKQQAEVGQMAGQVGQNEAIDGANPKASGLGANIMLSTDYIDDAFEMIRKRREKPSYDSDKPQKTTTIDTVRARDRAKTGKKRKSRKNITLESQKRKRRRKGKGAPLKAGNVRNPGSMSSMAGARAGYMSMGPGYTYRQRTAPRFLTTSTGRSRAKQSYSDPRKREAEAMRQQIRQNQPTQDITPPAPTVTPQMRLTRGPRGRGRSKPHTKAMRQPRTAKTPMGAHTSEETSLAGGSASAMAGGGIGSSESILASTEFLKGRQKVNLGISPRDKIEYRNLIDKLNTLLRQLMRKADGAGGADSGASPNASGGNTSNPTGATETDPEDDPTRWGAHPYDLYVSRGGIA